MSNTIRVLSENRILRDKLSRLINYRFERCVFVVQVDRVDCRFQQFRVHTRVWRIDLFEYRLHRRSRMVHYRCKFSAAKFTCMNKVLFPLFLWVCFNMTTACSENCVFQNSKCKVNLLERNDKWRKETNHRAITATFFYHQATFKSRALNIKSKLAIRQRLTELIEFAVWILNFYTQH